MKMQTINPATEAVIQEYDILTASELDRLLDLAHTAYLSWKKTDFAHRKTLMLHLSELLLQQKEMFASLITTEMGKPITQARAEIEKCAWVCRHFAEEAEHYLESRFINTEMSKTMVCYQPLGIVLAIMPWNFPFWQVFRFLAPTIMAGNGAVLKHAPISLGVGQAIHSLMLEAGFPPYLFQHLILSNDMTSNVLEHKAIVGLSFTGSDTTGRIVAQLASANLKKSVLELGGSDPYLVLEDADISLAANTLVTARLANAGQVCISPKRMIVMDSVYEQFIQEVLKLMMSYQMAEPHDENTKLGPMARKDLRNKLHEQVKKSIEKGAKCLIGGYLPEGKGFYYPATLLVNVEPGMPAFDEELFGPVVCIIRVDNEKKAIDLANNSLYGLAAGVFTRNLHKGEAIALALEAGTCYINTNVSSDPRLPFGGIKQSGFGRELSQEGILEFVNIKTMGF